jgi:hypothetical protein
MANFYSKYTGDQIDLSISSGSSVTGKIIDNSLISGSSVSTGSFGRLEVADNATIGGNITFGDSTSDSVSISADLTSNLIPNEDNTYDLGSKAQAWRTLHVHNISASGAITASGDITSSADIYGKKVIVGTQTGIVPSGSVIGITVQGDISSSGNFLGAATSTGSFGIVNTQGHISAAGNLQVDGTTTLGNATGDDVTITGYLASSLLPKTINTYDLGSKAKAWRRLHVANISASNDITASGKIVSTDEFHLMDTSIGGDTLIRGYASSDDGIIDVYQEGSVKARINGNGASYFGGGTLAVNTATNATNMELTVAGDISSSGGFYTDGTLTKYRREVLGTIPNGVTMDVSSSGAMILQSTNGATITLPAMGAALKGVQYTFVHAGTATHTWNLSPNSSDKIMGSCIDSNAIATVVEGASNGAGADDKDLQLDAGSGVGDRVTIVGDGADGWYITECIGSFAFES